jgi:hypothetical protein
VTWTIGGSPIDYHNAVVRANLDPAEADHTIAESLQRMQARGVPGTWHVGPSMQPADIGTRLQAHGFCSGGDEIGMAVALNDIPRRVAAPASFRVVPVRTQRDLERWVAVLGSGFGEGEREAEWVGAMYVCIGLGDEVPWRHYWGCSTTCPWPPPRSSCTRGRPASISCTLSQPLDARARGGDHARGAARGAQAHAKVYSLAQRRCT